MKKKFILIALMFLVLNNYAKEPIENKKQVKIYTIKPMNWFTDILDGIASLWQPVWGKYSEGGATNKSVPLACADRKTEIDDLRQILNARIKPGQYFNSTINKIYEQIFINANTPIVSCKDEEVCASASIAKDAAFVYWLGIDKYGDSLSPTARQVYFDIVKNIMWSWADSKAGAYKGKNKQVYRAKENIMLMQAYNFLEMAKLENPALLPDDARDDLREEIFEFTYQLYSWGNNLGGALNGYIGNNMTLIVAAAVGMGAVIISERQTYLLAIQRKPERWANAAHAFIQSTMFEGSGSMADASIGDGGSFAEGPFYFKFAFEALLPFFQSFKNFTNGKEFSFGPYYKCGLCIKEYNLNTNYYNNSNYLGLADWYNNIKMPNGDAPTIDDSWSVDNHFGGIALTGEPRHSIVADPTLILVNPHMNLMADYLARYNYYDEGNNIIKDSYKSYNGDIVVRSNKDSAMQNQHYIHLNVERDKAINGGDPSIYLIPFFDPFTAGHEHADIGNIIIAAGEDVLALDPAYYGDNFINNSFTNYKVNQGYHHNVITIDGAGPDVDDETEWADLAKTSSGYKMSFKGNYWNYNFGIRTSKKAIITRDITVYRVNDTLAPYYEIHDYATNKNWFDDEVVSFRLNGNGYLEDGSYRLLDSNTALWDYPCKKDNDSSDNWKMQAIVTTLKNSVVIENNVKSYWGYHGNFSTIFNTQQTNTNGKTSIENITTNVGTGNPHGKHEIMVKKLTISPNEKAHFHTTIRVLKCTDKDTLIPQIQRTGKYTSHMLQFDNVDSLRNFHLTRIDKSLDIDSVMNPLNINSNTKLKTNAQTVFFSYSLNENPRFGCCVAKCNFRAASIENGDTLIYNDTLFIKTNNASVEANYRLVGKYKYQGYVRSESDAAVSFFLPDLDSNYKMKASADSLIYYYDDTAHVMTLFVKEGITNFVFELDDQCALNCYFPASIDSVKNTFNFNNGLVETLPHKLTITTPNGFLKINNGGVMSICPGNWLRNTDSLIMENGCINEDSKPGIVTCYDVNNPELPPTIKAVGSGSGGRPSTIIVNEQAALILDSGSYTRIGNNCTITVRPQGTLIIRKNAIVDIGDSRSCGYGLIICYFDSYIHFEDSSDIKFWKIENDSVDKQKFFIFLKPPTPLQPAHSGIEYSINNMIATIDTVIHLGTSVPICNITQIMPDYGINNRDWGWANFAKPKAWARLTKQTFCPGECPEINFDGMLNNINSTIKFYRIDTSYKNPTPLAYYTQINNPYSYTGGVRSDCDTFIDLPVLKLCNPALIAQNKWYIIKIKVENDCGDLDSIQIPYFMLKDFDASFTINQTSCIDSVFALENTDTFTHFYREKTQWHVHYIDSTGNALIPQKVNYGGDWEYTGIDYPTNFKFPNFKWVGGVYYAVSHTVSFPGCGTKTVWDTIFVAPGANIVLKRPTLYGQNISNNNTAVQLNGYVTNADSFNWSPTTWLDLTDPYNPISTPTDSITYILTAYKDGCTATDTAHIKYNRYANAGYSDTLCLDSVQRTETLIGFPYDMSLFLGVLYYYGPALFMTYYNSHNTGNDPNYFRYFTHFMHTQEFENDATRCPKNLYNLITNTIQKDLFFQKDWFKTYYKNFVQFNNISLPALVYFNYEVTSNSVFKMHLDSLATWGEIDPCINNIMNDYDNYYNYRFNEITTTWSRITGNDTTSLTQWDNYFVAIDEPTASSKYILSVITPSRAEIDEITILVDTLLTPLFAPTLQFDSTVLFMNYTEPISSTTSFEWNFGDGSANSFESNLIHTFPAFDSSYLVCLTVSNKCNSWQYCDTVWIDSAHWGGSLKTVIQKPFTRTNQPQVSQQLQANCQLLAASSQQLVAIYNYPNPFDKNTTIEYLILQPFTTAELRITNIIGQEIVNQKLYKPTDKVNIDGTILANGLYYYSIIIDGNVKQTKTMSVIR